MSNKLKAAYRAVFIANRHGIAIDDDEADPATVVERLLNELRERARTYRADIRALEDVAYELGNQTPEQRPGNGSLEEHAP